MTHNSRPSGKKQPDQGRASARQSRTLVGMPVFSDQTEDKKPRTLVDEVRNSQPESPMEHFFDKMKLTVWGQRMAEESALPTSEDPETDVSDFGLLSGMSRKSVENKYKIKRTDESSGREYVVDVRDIELPYGQGHLIMFREEKSNSTLAETLAFVPQGIFQDDTALCLPSDTSDPFAKHCNYINPKKTLDAIMDSIEQQKGNSWLPEIVDDDDNTPYIKESSRCSFFTVNWKRGKDFETTDQDYINAGARKLIGPSHSFGLGTDIVEEVTDELEASDSMQPAPPSAPPSPADYLSDTVDDPEFWAIASEAVSEDTIEMTGLPELKPEKKESKAELWCAYEALGDELVREEADYLLDDALKHISRSGLTAVVEGLLILYDTGTSLFALHLDQEGIQQCVSTSEQMTTSEARGYVYANNLFYMQLEQGDVSYPLESFMKMCTKYRAVSSPEDTLMIDILNTLGKERNPKQKEEDILTYGAITMQDGGAVFVVGQWGSRAIDKYLHPEEYQH